MLTPDNAEWIGLVLLAFLAIWGFVWHLGRDGTDWNAPATDADHVDDYTGPIPPVTWSGAIPPGGYVCAVTSPDMPDGICGWPIKADPCPAHGRLVVTRGDE